MIKKQIDPDLLVMLDTEVDLNFWENLPEARATGALYQKQPALICRLWITLSLKIT